MTVDGDRFEERILQLVAAIPAGRVATYGQLAFLAGRPRSSRLAGRASILGGAILIFIGVEIFVSSL